MSGIQFVAIVRERGSESGKKDSCKERKCVRRKIVHMYRNALSIVLCIFGSRLLRMSRRRHLRRAGSWNADSWVDRAMEASYDEDLSENPFLQILRREYGALFERAVKQGCIVCVPRCGSFAKSALVESDFLGHILVPSDEASGAQFRTLSGKEVKVCNRVLTVEYDIAKPCCSHLLFKETFYTDDQSKYSLWCIERPLEQSISACRDDVLAVTNLRESRDLLWTEVSNKAIIKDIDMAIDEFEQTNERLEDEPLASQRDLIGALYARSLRLLLQDERLRDKTTANRHFLQTIKVAVETYVLHGLRRLVPRAVSARTASTDASLNKTIKNLHDLQLRDLGVRTDIYDGILRGKLELSRLDNYVTVLGKIGCLKKAVRYISDGVTLVSSDDILPVLIFLVIRAGLPNWTAQLAFMKQFRFSVNSPNEADEAGFLITSLEAAVEHVRSGVLRAPMNAQPPRDDSEEISLSNLFAAIVRHDLPQVTKILLKESSTIPRDNVALCHPLCLCESCERRLAGVSISGRPTVRSRDDRGMTAIHVASLCGHEAIVDFLLENGASADDADADGSTPLHCAASRGQQTTLLQLLHANADPTVADTRGNTPLHLAADHGHEGCVKALLYFTEQMKIPIDKSAANSNGETPLHHAAKWGYGNIVEILLEHGANPRATNRRGQTPLVVAHSSRISRLLEVSPADHDPRVIPYVPTRRASENANSAPQKREAKTSASRNGSRKADRLLAAIREGDLRLACYYLGFEGPHRSPVDEAPSLCHPLCNCERCAPGEDSTDEQERAPTLGLNICNERGETALHVACATGQTELVQMLLDAGADINVTTVDGRTPLHMACVHSQAKIAKMLLNCGTCDVNAKDCAGETSLHFVARAGDARIAQLLVRHGANVKQRNSRGMSALETVETVVTNDIFLSQSFSSIVKIFKTNGVHNVGHDALA